MLQVRKVVVNCSFRLCIIIRPIICTGSRSQTREGQYWGRKGSAQDIPGLIYSKQLSRGQNRYSADADWGVLGKGAHWRHLVNTTEPPRLLSFMRLWELLDVLVIVSTEFKCMSLGQSSGSSKCLLEEVEERCSRYCEEWTLVRRWWQLHGVTFPLACHADVESIEEKLQDTQTKNTLVRPSYKQQHL